VELALFKSKPGVGRARNLFQEFLFKTEYAYDYGMPQWLARLDHALAPLRLERLFLGRHKFHHFRVFYRDELSGYLREVLLDPRSVSRSYLHRSGVEKILNGHLKGNRNYTLEIHKLLTAEPGPAGIDRAVWKIGGFGFEAKRDRCGAAQVICREWLLRRTSLERRTRS
jgi:hypothetical protein